MQDNTIVVFMGDNGLAFPYGKGGLYDPGLHVPLIVNWPGKTKPGVSGHLISGGDPAPTPIEAARGTPPAEMAGRSFRSLLEGQSYGPRKYVFASRIQHGNGAFTRTTKADESGRPNCNLPRLVIELYDLHNDAAEFKNLADRPELAGMLQKHLLTVTLGRFPSERSTGKSYELIPIRRVYFPMDESASAGKGMGKTKSSGVT